MSLRPLLCTRCGVSLPAEREALAGLRACPSCQSSLEVLVFPALFRPTSAGSAGEAVLESREAGCFYHPAKRASVPCAVCGRFLCALCDVELSGRHYCPPCLEKGGKRGAIQTIERQRIRYDNIAMALVTLSFLVWCAWVVTAPVAWFFIIRYWNAPPSLVERTRLRMSLAGGLAVVEFGLAAVFWAFLFRSGT